MRIVDNSFMRKSRRYSLTTLLIAVLGGFAWLILSPPSEPMYQGKTLSFWCDQYTANSLPESDIELQKQAETAIRAIGTNAVPTLLRMLKAKDSKFKRWLFQLGRKQRVLDINWKTAAFRHY